MEMMENINDGTDGAVLQMTEMMGNNGKQTMMTKWQGE